MSCIERAGWFSGLLSAVKLYQSVSISGPSATSKPIERKMASMRAQVRMTGCRTAAPTPATRQRDIERLFGESRLELCVGEGAAARIERRLEPRLCRVDRLPALRRASGASEPSAFSSAVSSPLLPR